MVEATAALNDLEIDGILALAPDILSSFVNRKETASDKLSKQYPWFFELAKTLFVSLCQENNRWTFLEVDLVEKFVLHYDPYHKPGSGNVVLKVFQEFIYHLLTHSSM